MNPFAQPRSIRGCRICSLHGDLDCDVVNPAYLREYFLHLAYSITYILNSAAVVAQSRVQGVRMLLGIPCQPRVSSMKKPSPPSAIQHTDQTLRGLQNDINPAENEHMGFPRNRRHTGRHPW